jgi:predicted amino acid racemase
MTPTPYLSFDLDKIEHNTRTIVGLCRGRGIEVAGVTKCVRGHPQIAEAMLRGGAASIADSRLENVHRLRAAGIRSPLTLLRVPALSQVREVVAATNVSLNTELTVVRALSAAAQALGRRHDLILMVDLGDLREGIWPDDLVAFAREVCVLPGVRIWGLGTNLACFGGVVPTEQAMEHLVSLAHRVEEACSIDIGVISGFNSSGLDLIASGRTPGRVNHARIGEAILLGCETTQRRPWPGTAQDAFRLSAEVLELKRKPSIPIGERAEDAFGHRPVFEDHGPILRALLNLGREDVVIDGLRPLDPRLRILGASSGYLILDATAAGDALRVGSEVGFSVNYAALLAAMTSEYVGKCAQPGASGQLPRARRNRSTNCPKPGSPASANS